MKIFLVYILLFTTVSLSSGVCTISHAIIGTEIADFGSPSEEETKIESFTSINFRCFCENIKEVEKFTFVKATVNKLFSEGIYTFFNHVNTRFYLLYQSLLI